MVRGGKKFPVGGRPKAADPIKSRTFGATATECEQVKANARKAKFKSVGLYIVAKCGKGEE